jgi:tetratricopeptide (TPR) repeat protein
VTFNRLFSTTLLAATLAALSSGVAMGQALGGGGSLPYHDTNTRTKLDPPRPEGGWKSLSNLLEALKPGVDTRLDPTPSQITSHIERLLNAGKTQEALTMIEQREAQIQGQRGTDVQLMFQRARALSALGKEQEAMSLYTDMTTRFPELPEPWNNLAALYARQGSLERAKDALEMALRADPNYSEARANLGDIQLMMALRTYRQAESKGVSGTDVKAREIENMLKERQQK